MSVTSVGYAPVPPAALSMAGQPPKADTTVKQEPKREPPRNVQSTAANLNKFVFNRKLQFVVDHNSNQVIVKVIDKETDKVIKVLPPEELQRLHRNLKDSIGFLFDERV